MSRCPGAQHGAVPSVCQPSWPDMCLLAARFNSGSSLLAFLLASSVMDRLISSRTAQPLISPWDTSANKSGRQRTTQDVNDTPIQASRNYFVFQLGTASFGVAVGAH